MRILEIASILSAIMILAYIGIASTEVLYGIERPQLRENPAPTIKVVASQWFWNFTYPDGSSSMELRLKARQTYRLEIISKEPEGKIPVIHSFFVPELLYKLDAVPGHVNVIYLRVDQPGKYDIVCAEFCGLLHYAMNTKLIVE